MASHPTQDLLHLIRLLLLDSASITAIVDDRISGPFMNRTGDIVGEELYPRIVIDRVASHSPGFGGLQSPIIHVYAYSRTSQGDADNLYDTIKPLLRMARLARDGIAVKGSIRETDLSITGFNPQTNAWFARGTYRAIATALPASA